MDGKWIAEGDAVEIRSPYDGAVVGRVFQGRHQHAEAAIAAAVKAFGTTRRLPAFERQRVLRQVAQTLVERKEQFARTMAQEAGKPLKTARSEVDRAIFTFTVAAEESTRIQGEYLPLDWQEFTAGRWGIVRRFPLGPVAGIAVQFPFESCRSQGSARHCRGLSAGAQARAADPADGFAAGASGARSGLAGWRAQRFATLQRRRRVAGE